MRIVRGYPPNIREIAAQFPRARAPGVYFAYGDTLFTTTGGRVPPAIIAHEEAHSERQLHDGVEAWWLRYLADRDFRFEEELLGHRAEWSHIDRHYANATLKAQHLEQVALKLSGPLYNNMVSYIEAERLLRAA